MNLDLVLVTYNPDVSLLKSVIKSIASQVRHVIVVDNSPVVFSNTEIQSIENVRFIPLNENKGIAFAQNVGIKECINLKADYILLSDQDTIYPEAFVINMFKGVQCEFSAISPLFNDVHQKNSNQGFIKKSRFGFRKFYPSSGVHSVFQTIASGCILNVKDLDAIGLMDEELFIDWVDIEWCWRASNKGYKLLGNANVTISHQLGDGAVSVGFREVNIRSPFRHYFITRNAFYLSLYCKNLGYIHRAVLFVKSFRYLIGFPVLSKPHAVHLKCTVRGFWHGITGNLGKYK